MMRRILARSMNAAWAGLILGLLLPGPGDGWPQAAAQDTLRAVAVVNDEVISMLDLYMRTRLAVLSSGVELTEETKSRLEQQVLRRLIDERLQLQEAERLSVTITDEDINGALDSIAQRNKMSGRQFKDLLARNQILPTAMEDQIRAELAWHNVIRIRLIPSIVISDEEIDEVVTRIKAGVGGSQVNLSEIYLEVDNPQAEEDVWRAANGLLAELRDGGDFAALATQFSQSATAAQGGNIGWIEESQLPEELAPVVRDMVPGRVTGPVRGLTGFYILHLRDRKPITGGEESVRLTQIFIDVPRGSDETQRQAVVAEAEALRAKMGNCAEANLLAKESGALGSGDLGLLPVKDLSPQLKGVVQTLPVEQPSEPLDIAGDIAILIVCERVGGEVDRSRVEQNLISQRLDVLARRYLRDLRRQANVDLRL